MQAESKGTSGRRAGGRVARRVAVTVALVVAGTTVAAHRAPAAPVPAPMAVVDPVVAADLASAAAAGETVTVLVRMRDRVDVRTRRTGAFGPRLAGVVNDLRTKAALSQVMLRAYLLLRQAQGTVVSFTSLWVNNSVSVTATPAVVAELAARPDVDLVSPDDIPIVRTATTPAALLRTATTSTDVARTQATALWDLGYTGQGVVVADLDSGVDVTHPDLASRYRGGTNSWFDPYAQMASPGDRTGHGTATTGVMVAGAASGSTIGMAPGATWIAARVFNNAGGATATAIHRSLQWVLDPDGNPATADAPRVVNNSWAYGAVGCNLEFQPDVQALRAAGILPVFAAGNYGPGASTSVSPANYPESIAVGSTDNADLIEPTSSRGPSTCGGRTGAYPDLVAPGVDVVTTDLFGTYFPYSGTSLAAPKVSGALALLASTQPDPSVDLVAALRTGAVDLGVAGADPVYGAGLVDVAAARLRIVEGPLPTTTTTTVPATTTTTLPATTTTVPATTTTTTLPPTTTTTVPATTTTTVAPDLGFADGFESGGLGAWNGAATNGGRLSVTAAAARTGTRGMQAVISSTTAMYVRDTSPAALAAYHARFQFAPNGVTLGSRTHDLIRVLDASGNVLASVQLRLSSGTYQVRSTARSGTSTKTSSWFAIGAAGSSIELGWTAATSATAANGALALWVGGSLKATVGSLTTGSSRVEEARLGPQALGSGISGTEYYDTFSSSRSSYLGG